MVCSCEGVLEQTTSVTALGSVMSPFKAWFSTVASRPAGSSTHSIMALLWCPLSSVDSRW
jgi:hypothetical protein